MTAKNITEGSCFRRLFGGACQSSGGMHPECKRLGQLKVYSVAVVFGYQTEGGRQTVLQIVMSGRGAAGIEFSVLHYSRQPTGRAVQYQWYSICRGVDVRAFSVRPGNGTALECKEYGCCETNRKR